MLTEFRRPFFIDGGLLAVAAPFLLFPARFWPGTLLALLLVIALWLRPLRRPHLLPPTPLNLSLLLFSLALGVGVLVTADPDLTLPKATGLLLGLTTWRVVGGMPPERRWIHVALLGFAGMGLGFAVLGVLSVNWLFKIPTLSAILKQLPAGIITLPGTGPEGTHANQLAGTLLLFLPFFWSILLGWKQTARPLRWVGAGAALSVTGLLLLTQSRSGWLGGAGGLFLLLALWAALLPPGRKRRLLRIGVLLFLLAGVVGAAVIGPDRLLALWEDPAQETVIGNLSTLSFRQEVWRWGLTASRDFPFTGTGLGTFRRVIFRFYPTTINPNYDIAHVHNIFLQVVLDAGIPGLIAYLALLGGAGVMGWRVARYNQALRPYALGLLAGLAALHVYGLGDALALGAKTGLLFWLALGALTVMQRWCSANC